MAKLKRKFIKMAVEEESTLSKDKLTKKLDGIIDTQYRRNLKKLKGSPLLLWSKVDDSRYRLKYYHSWKEDMCDTVMTVDIEKGMERCSLHGFIHKPAAIWACFAGVIASVIIDFIVISWLLLFTADFDLTQGLMFSGAVCLVRAYICVALVELSRDKVKILREELNRVIHDDQSGDDDTDGGNDGNDDESDDTEDLGDDTGY